MISGYKFTNSGCKSRYQTMTTISLKTRIFHSLTGLHIIFYHSTTTQIIAYVKQTCILQKCIRDPDKWDRNFTKHYCNLYQRLHQYKTWSNNRPILFHAKFRHIYQSYERAETQITVICWTYIGHLIQKLPSPEISVHLISFQNNTAVIKE